MPPRLPPREVISSAANPRVKWFKQLRERRGREATGAFLVEGPRAIEQALASGAVPLQVAYGPRLADENPRLATLLARLPPGLPAFPVVERVLQSIGDTQTTQGIVAAYPIPARAPDDLPEGVSLVLLLDRISDPGNMGTLLRSAAATGCDAVLLAEGCADPYSPKVVRASAGAIFSVPLAELGWQAMRRVLERLPNRLAAEARGEKVYYEADLGSPCVILIGNEAAGLSEAALALATASVRIPIESGVESLNAGVAGSLLLFEARRQRAQPSEEST